MDNLRSKIIRLAHSNEALRPHLLPLLREAAESNWTQEETKTMGVTPKGRDAVSGSGTLYKPAGELPKALSKIKAVVVFKPKGEMDAEAWWSGSGYFADAAKKAFGALGKHSMAYDYKDLGAPIGTPDDRAKAAVPAYVLVFV